MFIEVYEVGQWIETLFCSPLITTGGTQRGHEVSPSLSGVGLLVASRRWKERSPVREWLRTLLHDAQERP